jgi:hypothetical protein
MRLDERLREIPVLLLVPPELDDRDLKRLRQAVERVAQFAASPMRRLIDLLSVHTEPLGVTGQPVG